MKYTDREILAILTGTDCRGGCGRKKKAMRSHCPQCYHALPPEIQKALYDRFNDGYQEAFMSSLELLAELREDEKAEHPEVEVPVLDIVPAIDTDPTPQPAPVDAEPTSSLNVPKLCVIGGYTLDLYCVDCDNSGSFPGHSKQTSYDLARHGGWKINKDTARCANCSRKSK